MDEKCRSRFESRQLCLWGLDLCLLVYFMKEKSGRGTFSDTAEVWVHSVYTPFSHPVFWINEKQGCLMFYQKGYSVAKYHIKQVRQHALLGRMTSDGFPRVIAKDRFSESCFMMENPHTRAAD